MFKVYDQVWVMSCNKPIEMIVYSITQEMDFSKSGMETAYRLVASKTGACDSNSLGYNANYMFKTKQDLLESL